MSSSICPLPPQSLEEIAYEREIYAKGKDF